MIDTAGFRVMRAIAEEGSFTAAALALGYSQPAVSQHLKVLRENGFPVASSCEIGTCGTCETRVIEGVPDHRDSVLTQAEQAQWQGGVLKIIGPTYITLERTGD